MRYRHYFAASISIFALMVTTLQAEDDECCDEPSKFSMRQKFFGNFEFLYWKVKEGSLEYALQMKQPAASSTAPIFATGDYKISDFNWAPGFRVAFGYHRAPHYWEMFGQYTWYQAFGSHHSNHSAESNKFLNANWTTITSSPLERATSHIHFHYQVADFLVTRVFDPNPHLRLRVVGGVTAAFISQHWRIDYFNFVGDHDEIKNKWRFTSGGLRVGLTADWFLTECLFLSGKASFATLMGPYKNNSLQKTSVSTGGYDPNIPVRDAWIKDARLALHTQILLGLSYQHTFGECNPLDFEFFAGYEFNGWFNLHEVYHSSFDLPNSPKTNFLNTGTIGIQGLNLRATFGF